MAVVADMFKKLLPGKKTGHVETSLIEEFSYPKLGPGQLWDVTGAEIEKMGGRSGVFRREPDPGKEREKDVHDPG